MFHQATLRHTNSETLYVKTCQCQCLLYIFSELRRSKKSSSLLYVCPQLRHLFQEGNPPATLLAIPLNPVHLHNFHGGTTGGARDSAWKFCGALPGFGHQLWVLDDAMHPAKDANVWEVQISWMYLLIWRLIFKFANSPRREICSNIKQFEETWTRHKHALNNYPSQCLAVADSGTPNLSVSSIVVPILHSAETEAPASVLAWLATPLKHTYTCDREVSALEPHKAHRSATSETKGKGTKTNNHAKNATFFSHWGGERSYIFAILVPMIARNPTSRVTRLWPWRCAQERHQRWRPPRVMKWSSNWIGSQHGDQTPGAFYGFGSFPNVSKVLVTYMLLTWLYTLTKCKETRDLGSARRPGANGGQ